MPRIAFIGAGSLLFSRRLMIDILTFPELRDSTFALMDVDPKRLDYARRVAERILREGEFPARVEATTDRREALKGADHVVIMILVGGVEAIHPDIEIPLKYGVDQCIGDTLGPGGVFRALRTIPVIIDICRDMKEFCPDAWLLNYTNPMAMLCWAMNEATAIKNVGLCHSVQGTAWQLATIIHAPIHEISYWVAGINHQAWFLEYKWNGQDAYPLIRERMQDPLVYRRRPPRRTAQAPGLLRHGVQRPRLGVHALVPEAPRPAPEVHPRRRLERRQRLHPPALRDRPRGLRG
jgi:alpha-galactosidase